MEMKDFMVLVGALLVNLLLFTGLLYLPPLGVSSLESVYVLVWLTFGILINLGFLRRALRTRPQARRRKTSASASAPTPAPDPARRRQPLA